MEIEETTDKKPKVSFGKLTEGAVFLHTGNYFMKTPELDLDMHELSREDNRINSVNLMVGDHAYFSDAVEVYHRPEAKLMVNDE